MSVEKNTKVEKLDEASKKKEKIKKNKSSQGIASKLSLVVSLIALGSAGYLAYNSETESKTIEQNNHIYSTLEKQLDKLQVNQNEQKSVVDDLSAQNDSQMESIKAIQSQLISMNSQLDTPAKDLYMQMSVINIQSAIDYLTLAKDVAAFGGDIQNANSLADVAFNKIEASKVANISASDRKKVREALSNYVSKSDVVDKFLVIEQKASKLEYITPETAQLKPEKIENKYIKALSSIVKIEDIPKNQTLVSTNQIKQFVSDSLYRALISLQEAMYSNDQVSINQAKSVFIEIVKRYFIQDANAISLEKIVMDAKPQNTDVIDNNIDKIISKLSAQQNQLLANEQNFKRSMNEKGGKK